MTVYADGITFYETPSHGGFLLSPARERELAAALGAEREGLTDADARMGYEPGWYEEDCCALAVLWCWRELFPEVRDTRAELFSRLLYWMQSHEEHVRARTAG